MTEATDVTGSGGAGDPSETPMWVRAGRETLFGVLTTPAGPPRHVTVVLVSPHYAGGAAGGALEKNDFNVTLAHCLARVGFHVFRYDMRGSGDSTGTLRELNLGRLHTDDVSAVAAELGRRGLDQLLFVGKCFGGRTVAACVPKVRGLKGVALVSMTLRPPGIGTNDLHHDAVRPTIGMLRDVLNARRRRAVLRALWAWMKGAGRRMRWPFATLHPAVLAQMRDIVRKGVPLLLLYGTADDDYPDFLRAIRGSLGRLLARAGDLAQVRLLDGNVHGLGTLAVQQQVAASLVEWATYAASAATPAPEPGPALRPLGDAARS